MQEIGSGKRNQALPERVLRKERTQTVTDIGTIEQHATLPSAVEIKGHPFFLIKKETGYSLVSRICPHAGGEVEDDGDELYCPHHYWRFNRESGEGIFPPNCSLRAFDVTVEGNRLIAAYEPPTPRAMPSIPSG